MSWSRIVNTTISNYIKGEEVNILRNRKVLALFKSKGRITFNWSGTDMTWRVRYKRAPMQGYADSETLTFPRRDRWKTARLDWRGYAATDSMTKGEKLQNKGKEAIINVYSEIASSLMEDMNENFAEELYIDGNASGNGKRIHGMESWLGFSGTSRDFVATPVDTYAGLDTTLGTYGGAWEDSTKWPSLRGDPQFDFWSPILVDYTDAAWTASTKTWPNTCLEATSYGIIKTQRNKSKTGGLDVIFEEGELYRQFIDRLREKQRISLESNSSNSTLIKLGFTDVVNYDGVDITWEYGIPANTGYGLNIDSMELRSQQGQMFVPEGPDYDIASKSWRFSIDFYGNMVGNPRNSLKLKNFT